MGLYFAICIINAYVKTMGPMTTSVHKQWSLLLGALKDNDIEISYHYLS